MPIKLERKFEAEYGKKKGRLIFYKWRSKQNLKEDLVGGHVTALKLRLHDVKKMKAINPRKVRILGVGGMR